MQLKLNQCISFYYTINSGVGSHKSVLFHVLTDSMSLFLEKGTPTAVTNSYEALLKNFASYKADIGEIISKILSQNPLIMVHPKIIACGQPISNITGKNQTIPYQKQHSCPYISGSFTPLKQITMGLGYYFKIVMLCTRPEKCGAM